ncbi:MAG TPA: nucleotide exchange factor GrpE [Streptosporangiaceae bacterium]|nr:nucleotide exchange factor GrpE [Streptosporangiaceae bacterium]
MKPEEEEGQSPVIRDRRRIDPRTGQVREVPGQNRPGRHSASKPGSASPGGQDRPGGAGGQSAAAPGNGGAADSRPAGPAAGGDAGTSAATADALAKLAERTADLQRLQAEYANYRKRVERDRMAVREQALANVLSELLPVLDDIGRARQHGELSGGFKSVAESLEASVAKMGLTAFGEAGDPFDPTLHDALMHSYSADVTEPTAVQILQPGYKVGDRIVRPARVAVAEPGEDAAPADGDGDSGPDTSSGPADPDAASR